MSEGDSGCVEDADTDADAAAFADDDATKVVRDDLMSLLSLFLLIDEAEDDEDEADEDGTKGTATAAELVRAFRFEHRTM